MPPEPEKALELIALEEGTSLPRLIEYLWSPWYAKLWWIAIPIYWFPAGAPLKISFLDGFYSTDVAIVLNIVFLPITALVFLGFGFARRWLNSPRWRWGNQTPSISQNLLLRGGAPHYSVDRYDPRLGSL